MKRNNPVKACKCVNDMEWVSSVNIDILKTYNVQGIKKIERFVLICDWKTITVLL